MQPANLSKCDQTSLKKNLPVTNEIFVLAANPNFADSLPSILKGFRHRLSLLESIDDLFKIPFPEQPSCLICLNDSPEQHTGMEALHIIRKRNLLLPTLILDENWDREKIIQTIKSGASDCLALPLNPDALIKSLNTALEEFHQNHQRARMSHIAKERVNSLSRRELMVAQSLLRGKINKEIADDMDLSIVTIKMYRSRLIKKIQAGNTAELTRYLLLSGLEY